MASRSNAWHQECTELAKQLGKLYYLLATPSKEKSDLACMYGCRDYENDDDDDGDYVLSDKAKEELHRKKRELESDLEAKHLDLQMRRQG